MSLLSDRDLIELAAQDSGTPIVEPFLRESHSQGRLSYGLSPTGYDIRLSANEFWISRDYPDYIADPLNFDPSKVMKHLPLMEGENGDKWWVLPPGHHALGVTVERFIMPDDVAGIVQGKSTYARCGLIVNCTLIEPGWEGYLVVELHNASSYSMRVYAELGIAQVSFFRALSMPITGYAKKGGLYQKQPQRVIFPSERIGT